MENAIQNKIIEEEEMFIFQRFFGERKLLTMLLIGILAFFILYEYYKITPFRGSKFDKIAWLNAIESETDWQQVEKDKECIRGRMVADLISRYLITGNTKEEDVISLLGSGVDTQVRNLRCIEYTLGMCSGFKIDYDSLEICFDKNGNIKEVQVLQH